MVDQPDEALDHLMSEGLFDGEWYARAHPDVAASGLDPGTHYRRYGFRLLGRPANARAAGDPALTAAMRMPPPPDGQELARAHRVRLNLGDAVALAYARLHLPASRAHTADILAANLALLQEDRRGWLRGLNAMLHAGGNPTVTLRRGPCMLFDQLAADPGPPLSEGPLVSVIMPAWNAEKTIAGAVRSILAQSWRNLELIVIDDASTDSTGSILARLAQQDERIVLRRNAVNVGPYVSKNLGLDLARGQWITGQDADDWSHPRRLALHLGAVLACHSPPRASLTQMIRMQEDGRFDTFSACMPFSPDGVTRIASISALYAARFLRDRLGYWDSVRYGADSEMIARAGLILQDEMTVLPQLTMLCLSTERGLTLHPASRTGINDGQPVPNRTAYEAAWKRVHETMTPHEARLPFRQVPRRYQGGFDHHVPDEDLLYVRG